MIASLPASLPPGGILILGALLVPLLRGRMQKIYLVALPAVSLLVALPLFGMQHGEYLPVTLFDYSLNLIRLDRLSLAFGLVFHLAALISVIYALHLRDNLQHVAGLIYAGAGIGAVFAGDLITLFVYWELTALASVFLIWAGRTERSYRAGMRYVIVQVGSGVILLSGILFHVHETGSIQFGHLGLGSVGANLIFLAFGIKCAFPLLHNWLADAYPEASATGTVFLSAFTTKLAVYALARSFAGTEILIYIGLAMALFLIFFAVIENDLRRVLVYSLNNQLGFMVIGIGVGTEMALNGTVAHAFASILYKALLLMALGAVLERVGTAKASELGGLYRSMPFTAACCVVGAASIAGVPFLCGFVTKSMIITAVGDQHMTLVFLGLLFASAGVMVHSGIKVPFFAFFGHDSGKRCEEAPWNMRIAMGATALLCIVIGVFPGPLYDILPYPVDYQPYTASHMITSFQLLLGSGLACALLLGKGLYARGIRSVTLDTDWVYRRLLPPIYRGIQGTAATGFALSSTFVRSRLHGGVKAIYRSTGPYSVFARSWPTGTTVLWVSVILSAILLVYYSQSR